MAGVRQQRKFRKQLSVLTGKDRESGISQASRRIGAADEKRQSPQDVAIEGIERALNLSRAKTQCEDATPFDLLRFVKMPAFQVFANNKFKGILAKAMLSGLKERWGRC